MDQHDQELLGKQLAHITSAPPNNGVLMMAVTVVFVVGLTLGASLFAYQSEPIRVASNHLPSAISVSNGDLVAQ